MTSTEQFDNNICFDWQSLGFSFSSVGRAMDSSPRGAGFDPRHGYVTQSDINEEKSLPRPPYCSSPTNFPGRSIVLGEGWVGVGGGGVGRRARAPVPTEQNKQVRRHFPGRVWGASPKQNLFVFSAPNLENEKCFANLRLSR